MSEGILPGTQAISGTERRKAITAGVIGTIVEWYDYAIYGFLATTIASNFFPSEDETTALLATFATFGIGFVARPLGGIVIGRMGDRVGRKAALVTTLLLMVIATVGIGLLPSYASIGIAAPVALVLLRLLQGFSAGGEWGASAAFIVEWAPSNRRGLYGSFQQVSVGLGLLLGSATAAIFASFLAPEQMSDFGWRIPFILGGVLLPIGMYIRRNINETPAFEAAGGDSEPVASPVAPAVKTFAVSILWTVAFYIALTYMPTFTEKQVGLTKAEALWSNTIGLALFTISIPLFGLLSDHIGRRRTMLISIASFLLLTYALFSFMLSMGTLSSVLITQLILALMLAAFSGPGPAAVVEIFHTAGRSTWMSTAYSLAVALFGGFAPYISTWLIKVTGTPIAPTYYVMLAAFISMVGIAAMKETAFSKLK
ncbi:MFS transporter [Mesorhizobium loti]|nr:MFS transporter [Mesorhizobium loti]